MIERIQYNGATVAAFGVGAMGDPEIWTKLSTEQQTWIVATLTKLNDLIVKSTGTTCPTWGPSITAAGGCFQGWYNANYLPLNPAAIQLRTDGVFDEDTLCALIVQAALNPQEFPTPFPDPAKQYCQVPADALAAEEKKKLSTGAMFGIGVATSVVVVGGISYAVMRRGGKKTRKKSRRRRR